MCGCSGTAAAPGPGYVEGAIGPELAQQRATSAARSSAMASGAQGLGTGDAGAIFAGDTLAPPQRVAGVELEHLIDPSKVDDSTGWPSLPGRWVAGWDGESGATSPVRH